MDIQKAKERDLFLRTELGRGKFGDEEVSISLAINGNFLLVEFKEAKYIVNVQSIVEDVIEFRKTENQSKCFSVDSKDLFDKKKNPNLSLSPIEILENDKIKKRVLK